MRKPSSSITRWLEAAHPSVFAFYAIFTSFSVYFCMYAFRKPFSAATYEGYEELAWLSGLDFKTVIVISQIIGYALSKFIGIKFCSEITRSKRAIALLLLILCAQATLFMFAVVPLQFKILAMFLNGIPLGMVWGMVVSYLEGRKLSELLLAGLSCSFIMSSGIVKDFGRWLMISYGVGEFWMPFVTGLFFLPPYILFVWLLNQIPAPSHFDEEARTRREPMDARQRADFIMKFLPGMVMLLIAYFFLTAYRDFRDNFQVDVFEAIGYGDQLGILSQSEITVAIGVLIALAALNAIQNNTWGLIGAYAIMAGGTALLGIGTLLFDLGLISGMTWMICTGLGSYLAYVPYGSVLFDRTIAVTKIVATAVFAIYVADAIGYLGAITVLTLKDTLFADLSKLEMFRYFSYFMSFLATVLLACSCIYFLQRSAAFQKEQTEKKPESTNPTPAA